MCSPWPSRVVLRGRTSTDRQQICRPRQARNSVRRLLPVSILVCVCRHAVAELQQNRYTSYSDIAKALAIKEKAAEYCEGGFHGSDKFNRDRKRKMLLASTGGDNFFLDASRESSNSGQPFGDVAMGNFQKGPALGIFRPFVVACIMIFFFLFPFCWTACPCCQCCRYCRVREAEPTKFPVRVCGCVVFLGFAITIAVICGVAAGSYRSANHGFDNVNCAVAQLFDVSLTGSSEDEFLGIMGYLETLDKLEGVLSPGSNFVNEVDEILESTAFIDHAAAAARESLTLLKEMLTVDANVNPQQLYYPNPLSPSDHKCALCERSIPKIDAAIDVLGSGFTKALQDVRSEIRTQVVGAGGEMLKSFVGGVATPLIDQRDALALQADAVLVDLFPAVGTTLKGPGAKTGVGGLLSIALLWSILAVLTMICCVLCETSSSQDELPINAAKRVSVTFTNAVMEEGDGLVGAKNPFNPIVHRCACCTWCCGCCYGWVLFMFSTLVLLASFPASGVCLVLDEMSSETLIDMGPAMGNDGQEGGESEDEGGEQLLYDMVDGCIAGIEGKKNNLMDMLVVDGKTVRQRLQTEVKGSILSAFDKSGEGEASEPMATSDPVVLLISDYVGPVVIYTNDRDTCANAADYMEMSSDTRSPPVTLAAYTDTSLLCEDREYTIGSTSFTYPGLRNFLTALEVYNAGFSTDADACTSSSTSVERSNVLRDASAKLLTTCPGVPSVDQARCNAAKTYLDNKDSMFNNGAVYRCDLFEDPYWPPVYCDVIPSSPYYRPWDVSDEDPSRHSLGCVKVESDGRAVLTPKERFCTYEQFVEYIEQWEERIHKVFSDLDASAVLVSPTINNGLKKAVKDNIFAPMDDLIDGSSCKFLVPIYRQVIDGFCFQGVASFYSIGKSYEACASIVLTALLIMYGVWRRTIDNYNAWGAVKETE